MKELLKELLKELPLEIVEKIILYRISTPHAECMKEEWLRQRKEKVQVMLKGLENIVYYFKMIHPFTGQHRPSYALYNRIFAEDDEDELCEYCHIDFPMEDSQYCFDCSESYHMSLISSSAYLKFD